MLSEWWGNDESYLGLRGSSPDDDDRNLRLHQFHRPGDGTSGAQGFSVAPLRVSLFSLLVKGTMTSPRARRMAAFIAWKAQLASPKAAQRLRRRRKGLTAKARAER